MSPRSTPTDPQVREFIRRVADVVAANMAAGLADVAPGEIINVSGGSEVSLADAIVLAEELLGHDDRARDRDRRPW